MSSTGIWWTDQDVKFAQTDFEYPFRTLTWGSPEAIKQGAGVMKSDISIEGSFWVVPSNTTYNETTREPSLMDMTIFTIVQLVLGLPGGADLKVYSDNVTCTSSGNVESVGCDLLNVENGMCPLLSYLNSMLRKTAYNSTNPFSYDRFLLRAIPPPPVLNSSSSVPSNTGTTLPLPFYVKRVDKCRDSPLTVFAVIPPLGYRNLGAFVQRSTEITSSPNDLLFIKDDTRFCQPPGALLPWSTATNTAWGYFQAQDVTAKVTTEVPSATIEKKYVQQTATYRYRMILDVIWNKLIWNLSPTVAGQTNTSNRNTYSSVLPWALNAQLRRYFDNAPESFNGIQTRLRTVFDAGENCNIAVQQGLSNERFHLLVANPVVHVTGSRYTVSPTPTNQLTIFLSFCDILSCCQGLYEFTKFNWDIFAYPPLPTGTTGLDPISRPGRVICLAQNWEWNMEPDGITCDKITQALCNPSSFLWNNFQTDPDCYPSCICINIDAFIVRVFGTPPYPSSYTGAINNLKATIQCFYIDCANNAKALKNSRAMPFSTACPPSKTCIVEGIKIDSGNLTRVNIINNCGGDLGGDGDTGNDREPGENGGGAIGTTAIILAVASVFALIVAAFVMISLRRRRSRETERRERREREREDEQRIARNQRNQRSRQTRTKTKTYRKRRDYGEDQDEDYEYSSEEDY